MAVDVLIEKVTEAPRAAGIAGLRTEGSEPHEIACLDLDPVAIEPVHGLALEHIKAVLHDMSLGKANDGAGLQRDDGDMHVMPEVRGIDKARGRPAAISA